MSAEEAIHNTWTNDATLTALIPAAKFKTGWQEPEDDFVPEKKLLPFATLTRLEGDEVENTSSNTELATFSFRFDVWTDNLADTKKSVKRIKTLYRKYDAEWIDGKILNMTARPHSEARQADGVWHAAIEFEALTEETFSRSR